MLCDTQGGCMLERATVKEIHNELDDAIKAVAIKHGFEFDGIKTLSWDMTHISGRVSILVDKEKHEEKQEARAASFAPFKVGDKLTVYGKTYDVIGLTPRGLPRVTLNGKTYRIPTRAMKDVVKKETL